MYLNAEESASNFVKAIDVYLSDVSDWRHGKRPKSA